jgi:hypothetical protein
MTAGEWTTWNTADLTAELRKLRAMKCWRSVTIIERVLHDRQPVEMAQDAYYYGTAADLRKLSGCTCGGIADTGSHSQGCPWALQRRSVR